MTEDVKEYARLHLDSFLPDAIGTTLESYQTFLQAETERARKRELEKVETQCTAPLSKEFLEFHKACKAALSNVEQLLKLTDWSNVPAATKDDYKKMEDMIAKAEARIYANNVSPIQSV